MSNKSKREHQQHEQPQSDNNQSAEEAVQATQESLDQVRDILFGNQMRDHDRRFAQIDEKLAAELADFRQETKKSLTALEEFVKSEFAALSQRLTAEANQRQQSELKFGDQLHATTQNLESKVSAFD